MEGESRGRVGGRKKGEEGWREKVGGEGLEGESRGRRVGGRK